MNIIMKKYYLLGILILLFASCIDDKSDLGLNHISQIKFKTQFEKDPYRCDQWSEFKLEAPEIEQTYQAKPVSYRWEINYQEVSKEKDLTYLCTELTQDQGVQGRLIVSNEDGEAYLDFRLKVTSPYEEGLVVLSQFNNGSMVSFKREDIENTKFQLNAYSLNNPLVSLGKKPTALLQQAGKLYIATEDPTQIVLVNDKTFAAEKKIPNPDPELKYMIGNSSGSFGLTFFGGGKMLSFDNSQDGYMNAPQKMLEMMYPGAYLADKGMRLYNGKYSDDILFYDNTFGMLLYGEWQCSSLLPETFKGKTLVDMIPCKHGEEALVFVQHKTTGIIEIVDISPLVPVIHSVTPVTGSGITTHSAFLASQESVILYYSVGNKVFRYDYSSQGHFQSQPDFIVGKDGDVIKTMILSPDESKLYIAVNSSDGEYIGDVYCFDNKTRTELWHETGIAGEIVEMIYKE